MGFVNLTMMTRFTGSAAIANAVSPSSCPPSLPFGQVRVRLACAWPILIGMRTIEKLRTLTVAELGQPVKVSRRELRGILLRSLASCPVPALWRRQLPRAGKQLLRA